MKKINPSKANLYHGAILLALVCCFSWSTHVRNRAWKNDVTLWTAAVQKAPDNARALNTLAVELAWGTESRHPRRFEFALELLERALINPMPTKNGKAGVYGNMALIYFYQKDDHESAFAMFEKALTVHPDNLKIRRDFTSALIISGAYDKALTQAEILVQKNKNNGIYHNLKGLVLLWQGSYKESLHSFSAAYNLMSDKESVMLNTAVALMLLERYEDAEKLLVESIRRHTDSITFYMARVENLARARENRKAAEIAQKMIERFGRLEVEKAIERYGDNPRYAPLSKKRIAQIVLPVIKEQIYNK